MSSLDDIIGECQKDSELRRIAELESISKVIPDPMCLIAKVKADRLERWQIEEFTKRIQHIFRENGAIPPPILVADQFVDFLAIPKSMLKEEA